MKKQKWLKRMMALAMVCGVLLSANNVVYAMEKSVSDTKTVGTALVTVELGYSGTFAHAKVTAGDRVNASMSGEAYSLLGNMPLSASFEFDYYKEAYTYCPGDVYYAYCIFNIDNYEGSWYRKLEI